MRLIITHPEFELDVKAPKYIMYKNPHDAFYELLEETKKVQFLYLKNDGTNSFCVPVNKFNESLIEVEYEDDDVLMDHPSDIEKDCNKPKADDLKQSIYELTNNLSEELKEKIAHKFIKLLSNEIKKND